MAETQTPEGAPDNSWQFKPEDTGAAGHVTTSDMSSVEPEHVTPTATAIPPTGPDGSITWTASEFIAHNKSAGWYLALSGAAVVLAALVWLLTKDLISTGVVIAGGVLLAVYGARQPRQLEYRLDQQGLSIGAKHYGYHAFRSFAVVPEGAFNSVVLVPLKRFAPLTTIYYAPDDEEKIIALLADRLPMEERKKDAIDRLMWRIRF